MNKKLTKGKLVLDEKSLEILGLFTNDYSKRLHVREIARLLRINHRTVLLHLNNLEQEKILMKKMVGRATHFFLNIENIPTKIAIELAENYAMLSFVRDHFLIKNVLTELEERSAVDGCLILFGGWAKGYATESSDIDLLLIGKVLNAKVLKDIETRTGKHLSLKVVSAGDFMHALTSKDRLVWEIVHAHRILKRAGLFVDFVWRYYHDR